MSDWGITCINESNENTIFLLFVDNRNLPQTDTFYTNVFYRSPIVGAHGGRRDIFVDAKVYGVCGTAEKALDTGVSVRDAQPTLIPLRPSPEQPSAITCDADTDNLSFLDTVTTMSTLNDGEIGIDVNPYSTDKLPNAFIGYGKLIPGDAGFVTPVLTTKAFPGRPCKMSPKAAFFVANIPSTAAGPFRGYISSAEDFGSVATIDFTRQPKGKRFAERNIIRMNEVSGNFQGG
ncbi:hypothetical protein KCU93_g8859, partial [Aureobasidium melanogenum]